MKCCVGVADATFQFFLSYNASENSTLTGLRHCQVVDDRPDSVEDLSVSEKISVLFW